MKWLICIALLVSNSSFAVENLLSNPGFDRLKLDGAPAYWDLFIMPNNKAVGRSDSISHDGDFSILLHTPSPYAKEPINNWSQVVYDNLVDIPLRLTGSIRTQDVGEAAIWIQCFSKKRSRILSTSTTSSDMVLAGTHGWTEVRTELTPPAGTDFIMVRCVIKGKGKAWFDSLSLTAIEPEAIEAPLENLDESEGHSEPVADEFIAVSKAMQDTIRQLEATNKALLNQLNKIKKDLVQYRKEVAEAPSKNSRPRGLHPIVPFDYDAEKDSLNE